MKFDVLASNAGLTRFRFVGNMRPFYKKYCAKNKKNLFRYSYKKSGSAFDFRAL